MSRLSRISAKVILMRRTLGMPHNSADLGAEGSCYRLGLTLGAPSIT